jgi:replication-associated recombination protein RarA
MIREQSYKNPFLSIVPRKGEEMIGFNKSKIDEFVTSILRGRKLLLVGGEHGSGKSMITDYIKNKLPSNIRVHKLMFMVDLVNELRNIPFHGTPAEKTVVFIDKFELCDVIDDKKLEKILELIVERSESGVSFVISLTPKTTYRLFSLSEKFKNMASIYTLPPLLYPQVVQLVISRLNEVRTKPVDSIKPFTDAELKNVYDKSRGNPRMILLILASLYDIKKQTE